MIRRRHRFLFTTLAILGLLLTQFQNCGPAPESNEVSDAKGNVRIIEDWSKAELQFVLTDMQVHDEANTASLQGFCHRERNGRSLRWSLRAGQSAGESMAVGEGVCQNGQFEVLIEGLDGFVCGDQHLLVVEGDWGASTYGYFQRRCQPVAAEVATAPSGSPIGTECNLEYRPGAEDSATSSCSQVCYRQGLVVAHRSLPVGACSALAARLAGP